MVVVYSSLCRCPLLLIFLVSCTPVFAAQIGYWPGEGTASDLSGNGNNGSLLNGASFGTGTVGQGFVFDGTDDIVSVSDSNILQPSEITVATWVKVHSIPDGEFAHIVERAASDEGYNLNVSTSIARFALITDTSGTPITAEGTTDIVVDGEFHHIAGTFDGTNVKVFVDGTLEGVSPASGVIQYTSSLALIFGGNQPPSSNRFFDGVIDEVMIFDEALSEDQIRQLAPELYGDFDADGDVDGLDFLRWQRGETPNPYSASELAEWEANYGTPLFARAFAVPEPASFALLVSTLCLSVRRRR